MAGPSDINNKIQTHIQEILENLFVHLAIHPVISNPPILDANGNQIRINKFRDFDGIELKNASDGLTLSIYPYSYIQSDTGGMLTTQTPNASIGYKPYTLGSGASPMGPLDETKAYIMLKLHYFGYNTQLTTDPFIQANQSTIFEFNKAEQVLRQWMEIIRLVLVSDLRKLPSVIGRPRFLLTNSTVNWINFNSGVWDKEANLIFHTASMLWETCYYSKRNIDNHNLIDIVGGQVGTLGAVPVCYNLTQDRYYNCTTNETIPVTDLVDPATGTFYDTLNVNVVKIIDMISQSRNDFVTIDSQS